MERSKIYLFSEGGMSALRHFIDRDTLFAFDFDGTLAPIAAEPSGVSIPHEVKARLSHLSRIASVAVVTGRARADVLNHLGFSPGLVIGNHGAEGLPGREKIENGYVRLAGKWAAQLNVLLPQTSRSGICVENKGATLSLHYRNSPDRDGAYKSILDVLDRLTPPPGRVAGKYVVNLVPPDAPHKGEALSLIMSHLGCRKAIFVGDDETDEDVFRLEADNILGIRVEDASDSAARIVMRDQNEIGRLLDKIIATLGALPEKHSSRK